MKTTLLWLSTVLVLVAAMMAGPTTARAAGTSTPTAIVITSALNVREGPGTNYAIVAVVSPGETLPIAARNANADWYEVTLPSGSGGWVYAALVIVSGDTTALTVADAPAGAGLAPVTASAGNTIVFQTSSGSIIYAVNDDGTGLRRLTTGMDPALSPDGQWVAFTRWDGSGNGASGSLWVINIDGSAERQLMTAANQPKSPTWSPDGAKIALSKQQGGSLVDTWVCFIDGKPTEVTQPINGARCMPKRADPNWSLRIVDVATGAYEDMPSTTHSFAPTWDPANAWHVVFRGDQGLMSLDINQKTIWVIKENGAQRSPVFSPDGTKIATTFRQNDHWEVHVMAADGSGETRLTDTPLTALAAQQSQGMAVHAWNNAAPAWSPDGSQIAFVTDRTGVWEIWIMNADGSNQHPLLPAATMASLNLQYDGVDERVITWR